MRYLLQGDAHPPSRYVTVSLELRDHVHRHIDRNGERQPHVTAAAAEDLRVDAHDLAGQVEQRPAGVTGVDRHIGLNERDIGIVRQGPTQGADDALGRGALQPERCADGKHPLPDLESAGIADRDGWQIFGVDFQQRNIGLRIAANHLGWELALVVQPDSDFVRLVHHMPVGDDITVGGNDETGP